MSSNLSQSQAVPEASPFNTALWLVPLALAVLIGALVIAALKMPAAASQTQPKNTEDMSSAFPLTVELHKRKVVVPARPMRIIAANAGLADIVSALVSPERIAGVPTTVDGFAGAQEFFDTHREITRFEKFQAETILSLKPDLVLVSIFQEASTIDVLEQQGIPVLMFEYYKTFGGIRNSFKMIGQAVGEDEKAAALIADFDARLSAVEKAIAGRKRPRALAYSKYDLGYAVGAGESQDELLRRAGASNATAEINLTGHVGFTTEQILTVQPDWFVVSGEEGLQSSQVQILLIDRSLAELPAIRERRIAVVPDRFFSSISQYVVNAVEILARHLHPDAFPNIAGERAKP
jgi:iron complex transport system substrate-binding protein